MPLLNRVEGKPFRKSKTLNVLAGDNYRAIDILNLVPPGELWYVSSFDITTPAGVTMVDWNLNNGDNPQGLGFYVAPGTYGLENFIQTFGQHIIIRSMDKITVHVSNTGANVNVDLFLKGIRVWEGSPTN